MVLASVAVILQEPVQPFELGVLHEVFGIDRTSDGVPAFKFQTCTENPGRPLESAGGLQVSGQASLEACMDAHLVAVPSGPMPRGASTAVLQQVREAFDRGAYLLGVCTGAFTLAEAGVLDNTTAATHWRYAQSLQSTYPNVTVDRDSLYRFERSLITSAGTAAGIDACLLLLRREHGPAVANRIARRMVVPPHRSGGQLQYVDLPFQTDREASELETLVSWLEEHLEDAHTLASLAAHMNMAPRTLTRRFRAEVGTSPMTWVKSRRIARAQELLENTSLSMSQIAVAVGFGSDALLRHHFRRDVGLPPLAYRNRFR